MRINKYVAQSSALSRRKADEAIAFGRVRINDQPAQAGDDVKPNDQVTLDNQSITPIVNSTIIFHKPVGYVVSRNGQGSSTIYELLPAEYQHLQPIGRLDKDTSGLLLLTNNGELAQQLTHPSYYKPKVYELTLDQPLTPLHRQMISDHGIQLEDGLSKLQLERLTDTDETQWRVRMHEGRNRQIRRTFAALGYTVTKLHRTQFGDYQLNRLSSGKAVVAASVTR